MAPDRHVQYYSNRGYWSHQPHSYSQEYYEKPNKQYQNYYSQPNTKYHNKISPYNRANNVNNYRYQTYYRYSQHNDNNYNSNFKRSYQNTGYALLRNDPQRNPVSTRLITCYTCGEKFTNKTALFAHRNEVHSKNSYYCSTCNKQFGVLRMLKEHEKTHTIQACPECPEVFKFKDSLLAHKAHAHSIPPPGEEQQRPDNDKSGFRNFNTPVAASTPAPSFSESSQDSGVHVKTETHVCSHCIKSFDSEEKLRNHSKIHTEEAAQFDSSSESRPSDKLNCPLCIKTFSNRRQLMLHLDSAHTQVFYCRKCPAEFTTSAELSAHSQVHT